MSSLPTLALKYPNKNFHMVFFKYTFEFLTEAVLDIIFFILCWGKNV
jgi:hypothetical protein